MVDIVARYAGNRSPGQTSALAGGKVLDRVEGKRREVGDVADHLPVPLGSEGVRGIRHHGDPAERLLNRACGTELPFRVFNDRIDPVVIAGHAAEVDRNDRFGLIGDRVCNRVVVHLKTVFLYVDDLQGRADVADDRSRGGIGIGRNDHLVPGTDPHRAERHLRTGGLAVQRDAARNAVLCLAHAEPGGDLFLQFFGLRSGRDPTGAKRISDLGDLLVAHVGRGERDFDQVRVWFAVAGMIHSHSFVTPDPRGENPLRDNE